MSSSAPDPPAPRDAYGGSDHLKRRFRSQWFLFCLAMLFLDALVGYDIYRAHRATTLQEENRLLTQARVVVKNLEQQLASADLALQGVVKAAPGWISAGQTGRAEAGRRLGALCDALPGIRTMLIVDAQGRALAANRTELIGLTFSRRDYFTTARLRNDPSLLYVSPPFNSPLKNK